MAQSQTQTPVLIGDNEVIYSAGKAVRRLQRVAPSVSAEIRD